MVQKRSNKKLLRLAAASMIAATSFALMYIGTLAVVFDLCAVTLGAVGTVFAVIELRGSWPWLIAAVCSMLCLLLLPDKFAAIEYMILGGIYPIVKSYIERLPKYFRWPLKLLYLNAMLTGGLMIAKYVLMISEEWVALNVAVYAMSNVTFILFDIFLTQIISIYINRYRKKLKIKF